ncbi:MAG TPA: DUF1801 domain-containing protein [Terriglobia bacterium]|nr:DUF1801 domain-containing protein [Terriglobia bacterium]
MKKVKSAHRESAPLATGVPESVDEYLAALPEPARKAVEKLRALIRSAVPAQATEKISYRMPALYYKGVLVWFAGFQNHCSLFPTPAIIQAFKNDLAGYTLSKGTIQFPLDKPLPAALIKKMVKMRIAQVESKKRR